jgi:hypothetical protein
MVALPGAFAALRKTKHSLILILGLPKAGESREPMPEWTEGALGTDAPLRKRSGRQRLVGILILVMILLLLVILVVLTVKSRRSLFQRWN